MFGIAALPMYDFPHLREAHDQLWKSIGRILEATGLEHVPPELTRGGNLQEMWRSPDLLLGQTCGFPLAKELGRSVQLVATPKYTAEGCRRTFYRSCIVVRRDEASETLADMRGKICALNEWSSNSGMNAFRAAIAPLACGQSFFADVVVTGSHAESLRSVAEGVADIAAIDCVTFHHLKLAAPDLVSAVRVLCWTRESPALPLVTSASTSKSTLAALRFALSEVSFAPDLKHVREQLQISGFELVSFDEYQPILEMERYAERLRYPKIC